jgi:cyclopropane fatty-acyl-phospholipid synthase-like methyltransferase
MGEEIHVGGASETDALARRAGITASTTVLDVCSALGGPARHLARTIGCKVTGLDATPKMHAEAVRRTRDAQLDGKVLRHGQGAVGARVCARCQTGRHGRVHRLARNRRHE